ncbi:hypothetical protein TYRP_015720 [Tyrophagus putrescentiae]|nr:hypothetical protein TYRP_015720 [Tyrophagus putrescentiae]
MLSNHSFSTLAAAPSMAYMINSPVATSVLSQAVKSQASASVAEQFARMQEQNQTLQRKLYSKNSETEKLQNKITKLEDELQTYRGLVEQIRHALDTGRSPVDAINIAMQHTNSGKSSKSSSCKKQNKKGPNCQCCYSTEKPFLCQWENCNKRFRQKQHLDAHQNVHTGRRYTCEWPNCSKSFCRKFNLVEHVKMHTHGNPNLCTFPGCGKSFSSKYGLIRHQAAQHSVAQ